MIYIIIIYFLIGLLLYLFQRNLIYFPTQKINHSYSKLILENQRETIEVIVLNPKKDLGLIYLGGNAEQVINNAEVFLKEFPSHTIYLFNYRGYGGSTGEPTEKGIYSDVIFLFDTIKDNHDKINVFGRSLGTGVATYLASKRPVEKMILVSPYESITSIAQKKFPIYPIFLLLKDPYESINRVKDIKAKTLFIIAEKDQIISKKHSIRLAKEFPEKQITFKTILNSEHNNISMNNEYYRHIKNFIKY